MKYPIHLQKQSLTLNRPALIVPGIIAALLVSVACSQKPEKHLALAPAASNSPFTPQLKTVALASPLPVAESSTPDKKNVQVLEPKKTGAKMLGYTSRDFGVSFHYPRQYAFLNAKAIAGDEDRMPLPDAGDRQIALARVEIPKGYYPDTDFESGYFLLSLNPALDEKQCQQWVGPNVVSTKTIDGTEFRFSEVRNGGRGHASLVRQYSTYTNNTCYELELGVNTSNEDGMAREVDHERVLGRLEGILETVQILPTADTIMPASQEPVTTAVSTPQNQ
jgi:hypothetical protein